MKKISQIFSGFSVAVLSLTSISTVAFSGVAFAAATYTCTWTGATDNNFSTATNWSGCNGAAPVPADTDTLVFDVTSLAADTTLNNDISGLAVTDLQFTGTNVSGEYYTLSLSGGAITVEGTLVNTSTGANPRIAADIVLGADLTISDAVYFDTGASSMQTIDLNGHNLNAGTGLSANKITGNGNISVPASSYLYLIKANTGWTGSLTIAADASAAIFAGSTTSANSITVADTGNLSLCHYEGADIASPLTVGGAEALTAAPGCGFGAAGPGGLDPTASVNWTGPITLTKNTTVSGSGEFKVSGTLGGNYTLTQAAGTDGRVVIASSSNTSQTPNGTQTSSQKTTDYKDNMPSTPIDVLGNNIAVVDGVYGAAYVSEGGILKGTGTVSSLEVYEGGIVAPGHSPGCLNTGNLTEGGTYQVEIGGTTECTGYDQMKVTGTVDVTGGLVSTSLYSGFVPKKGNVFTIISNDAADAVTGTFTDLPEGATFSQNGVTFKISYVGGTGNDVTLTVMNEPTVPDTGFALIAANPAATLALTASAALALAIIARKYGRQYSRVSQPTRKK